MKISELRAIINDQEQLTIVGPQGPLPVHFHVTEVGKNVKHFIDCGGKVRLQETARIQLWTANDTDHRLAPKKLLGILDKSQKALGMPDLEIEVEYQTAETKGIFSLGYQNGHFLLEPEYTDCLAREVCLPDASIATPEKSEKPVACAPGNGCC